MTIDYLETMKNEQVKAGNIQIFYQFIKNLYVLKNLFYKLPTFKADYLKLNPEYINYTNQIN